jgi:hypothetical protein
LIINNVHVDGQYHEFEYSIYGIGMKKHNNLKSLLTIIQGDADKVGLVKVGTISFKSFILYLQSISHKFRASKYNFITHNCQDFVAMFLEHFFDIFCKNPFRPEEQMRCSERGGIPKTPNSRIIFGFNDDRNLKLISSF